MDYNKRVTNARYEFERARKIYDETEDIDRREFALRLAEKSVGELKMVLGINPPDMIRSFLHTMIPNFEKEIEVMRSNRGKVPQAQTGGGGTGGTKDNDEDKMAGKIMEAIVSEKPNVKWSDIGGLEEAKRALEEAVIMPIKYPNFFNDVVKPWKGILLYGPPGTGKTYLAKACATQCDSVFFAISSSDLISKYVGESEKMIKVLFNEARKHESAIIFIDEIDSLCGARSENENESTRRVKTEFLVQMEGISNKGGKLLVLGATNIPWALDQAVKRRFEKRIYIPLPDEKAILYMLKKKIEDVPSRITDEDFVSLSKEAKNYSGSDIEVLCKDAAMEPLRFAQQTNKFQKLPTGKFMPVDPRTKADGYNVIQCSVYDLPDRSLELPALTKHDFQVSMKRSKCSVSLADLEQYVEWTKLYGEEGA